MGDVYDIYDWNIKGIPGEFFLNDELYSCDEEERWKESVIPYLWVSNKGRFYSTYSNRFYKPTHGDGHGHKAIKVCVEGKKYFIYAHRLLALAFKPNPNNYPIVRHLNDNPDDNDLDNLEWGTHLQNHMDAVDNGSYKPLSVIDRQKSYDKISIPVELTDINTKEKLYFKSIVTAAKSVGAQTANLYKVLYGIRPQTVGYTGRVITKEEYYAHTN